MYENNIFEIGIAILLLIWAVYMVAKSLFRQMTVGEFDEKCKDCDLNQIGKAKGNHTTK